MEARKGVLPPVDYRRPIQPPSIPPPRHHGRLPPSMALPGHGRSPAPAPPPRPIPPSSVPSLSSGQGFYTVESLKHATVVPPAQLLPPPRLLPRPEPFPLPERPLDRFDPPPPRPRPPFPDDRAFAPPPMGRPSRLDRGRPPLGRDIPPPRDLPPRNVGPLVRGGPRIRQPPPPFLMDPPMAGFHPGRDGRVRGWGPYRDFGLARRMDRGRPMQSVSARKQSQKTKPIPPATADKKSSVESQEQVEGGPGWCSVCQINCFKVETLNKHLAGKRHKRQLEKLNGEPEEEQKEGEEIHDEPEESKELDGEDLVMKEKDAIDVDEAEKTEVVVEGTEAPNEEKEIEQVEAAVTVKAAAPAAGKKRLVRDKDGGSATKKRQKATVTSDAQNVTVSAVVENENKAVDSENSGKVEKAAEVVEVCQLCNVTCSSKAILETHLKGKKHAFRLKKSAGISDSKGVVGESTIVATEADLANGSAGQSV